MPRPKGSKNRNTAAAQNGGEVIKTRRRCGRRAGTTIGNSIINTARTGWAATANEMAAASKAIETIASAFKPLNPQTGELVLEYVEHQTHLTQKPKVMHATAGGRR